MNRENRQKWQADALRCAGRIPNPACDLISAVNLSPDHFPAMKSAVQFSDASADAKRGIIRKHQDNQRTYDVVDIAA